MNTNSKRQAEYLQQGAIKRFLEVNITDEDNPLQAPVDNLMLNICRYYFPTDKFIVESQAYPGDTTSITGVTKGDKTKSNVMVSALHYNLERAFVIEAKRFPKPKTLLGGGWWNNNNYWDVHLEQLDGYMEKAQAQDGYPGTMHGMLAIGDRVRFYQKKKGREIGPSQLRSIRGQVTYHISNHTDSLKIEEALEEIKRALRRRQE